VKEMRNIVGEMAIIMMVVCELLFKDDSNS
jgi:hypothetical protein